MSSWSRRVLLAGRVLAAVARVAAELGGVDVLDGDPVLQRQREERSRLLLHRRVQRLGHAVTADVEEADLVADVAQTADELRRARARRVGHEVGDVEHR